MMVNRDHTTTAHVRMPASAKKGDVVPVQIKTNHPMEVGWHDDNTVDATATLGRLQAVRCLFNGLEVFRAVFGDGMAPDPYLSFSLKLRESGVFEVRWEDTDGTVAYAKHEIKVL